MAGRPTGERAMTGAERQRKHRERLRKEIIAANPHWNELTIQQKQIVQLKTRISELENNVFLYRTQISRLEANQQSRLVEKDYKSLIRLLHPDTAHQATLKQRTAAAQLLNQIRVKTRIFNPLTRGKPPPKH